VPVALGFGIGTPEQAAEAARRAPTGSSSAAGSCARAAESDDPAGAVGEVVGAHGRRPAGLSLPGRYSSHPLMALTLWTTAALVLWIVLWSLGSKAIDAFMIPLLIIMVGATIELLKKYLPNKRT
jgi:hypothetical protein